MYNYHASTFSEADFDEDFSTVLRRVYVWRVLNVLIGLWYALTLLPLHYRCRLCEESLGWSVAAS